MTTLVIVAVCFLVLGIALWAAAISALGNKRWVAGALRGVLGLLFFALAALAGAITIGIQGYRALTYEEVAATVKTSPVAPQRFRATITLPNQRLAMYELAGDAFYVDAHILKWHPWLNLLGLHTSYELDRVAGRYNAVTDERFVAGNRPAEFEVRVSTTGLLMRQVLRSSTP